MFSTSRKIAQQTAQQLLTGHFTLVAWWTLRHAGVFDAILRQESETREGLDLRVFATRTSMALDVLEPLLRYLVKAGLVTFKNDMAHLTSEGKGLLEHEDGVLELIRAYEPVLMMSEHLLAKLKTIGSSGGAGGAGSGVYRKTESLRNSEAKRYVGDVFPAVEDLVARHKLWQILDLSGGSSALLLYLARQLKNVVGVGIGADTAAVRRANAQITEADLEKRLIAVSANPVDVCVDTLRTFDRIGISRQLWNDLDCLIATRIFSELGTFNGDDAVQTIAKTLAATRRNFPKAHLLVIESVASPRFDKNYYAPELALLLELSRSTPWPPEKWRELFKGARFAIVEEVPLVTDGLTLFLCKPIAEKR